MKTIYLVRHAKSSWKEMGMKDEERPLNHRGKHDAPFMGKLLKRMKVNPALIVSSPAVRALTTAKIFAEELDYPSKKIEVDRSIYLADVAELYDYVNELDDDIDSVMIFGHNPGHTYFLNTITGESIDNMPTCSIAGVEFDIDKWNLIKKTTGQLKFFEYPKKYFK
jgi:phosphohistidine phosphatase